MNQMSLYQTNSLIEHEKLRAFVELVSNGPRPDGTYNYCREALQQRATLLLKELKHFVTYNNSYEIPAFRFFKKYQNASYYM